MGTPSRERIFRKDEVLFKEGDESTSMFLVSNGSISVRKKKGSNQVEIGRVFSNEVIGELSFFDRKPRSATAVALTDVVALEIDFDALEKIYSKVPNYLKTIMSAVAERLRKADNTIRRLQDQYVAENKKVGADGEAAGDTSDVLQATNYLDFEDIDKK
jgi:CRP/FNR family cyclic AMP-dependent transcriptional regulator